MEKKEIIQDKVIRKVFMNKGNLQKFVTIPAKCAIEDGDLVIVKKISEEQNQEMLEKLADD